MGTETPTEPDAPEDGAAGIDFDVERDGPRLAVALLAAIPLAIAGYILVSLGNEGEAVVWAFPVSWLVFAGLLYRHPTVSAQTGAGLFYLAIMVLLFPFMAIPTMVDATVGTIYNASGVAWLSLFIALIVLLAVCTPLALGLKWLSNRFE